jgi:hypothetical protein
MWLVIYRVSLCLASGLLHHDYYSVKDQEAFERLTLQDCRGHLLGWGIQEQPESKIGVPLQDFLAAVGAREKEKVKKRCISGR